MKLSQSMNKRSTSDCGIIVSHGSDRSWVHRHLHQRMNTYTLHRTKPYLASHSTTQHFTAPYLTQYCVTLITHTSLHLTAHTHIVALTCPRPHHECASRVTQYFEQHSESRLAQCAVSLIVPWTFGNEKGKGRNGREGRRKWGTGTGVDGVLDDMRARDKFLFQEGLTDSNNYYVYS